MIDHVPQPEELVRIPAPSGNGMDQSFSSSPFFQKIDWLSFGITTVLALLIYLITMAPDVTLENSGTFSTSAAYAGVAQPPGFPVWTVYSWLFIKLLPFSNIAWRVTIGSATAAALACGMVALMVSHGGKMLLENHPTFVRRKPAEQNYLRVVCGYIAGMAFGLSNPVWQRAVLVDFWALSTLLFAIMLCLLMCWMAAPQRRWFLYGAFFVFGLLLTSNQELITAIPALLFCVLLHDKKLGRDLSVFVAVAAGLGWLADKFNLISSSDSYLCKNITLELTFLLVAVVAVVIVITTRRIGSEWKSAVLCGIFLLLGLGWYFYISIASMTNPPVNWAYPRTVEGFVHAITRGQYEKANPTHDLSQFMGQLWMLTKQTGREFGWLYLAFAMLPFCWLHQMERIARNWILGLTSICVCVGPLLVALLNPSADRQTMELTAPYFTSMYVVLAVWAGLGLMIFGNMISKSSSQQLLDAAAIS